MSRKRRRAKGKSFYIDTGVALDYATNRDVQTVLFLERVRERGWQCVSSTFLAMEMADYHKEQTFIYEKVINKKWELRKALNERQNKRLTKADFAKTEEWFKEFTERYKRIIFYDFLQDENSWALAREMCFSSNLTAPDVIHVTSAIMGAANGYCDVLVTKDKLLAEEAEKVLATYKIKSRLKVMMLSEAKKRYFPT